VLNFPELLLGRMVDRFLQLFVTTTAIICQMPTNNDIPLTWLPRKPLLTYLQSG